MSRFQAISGLFGSSFGISASIYFVKHYLLFTVQPGQKGILFSKVSGLKEDIYDEGWHIMVPWIEHPIIFDVKTNTQNFKSETGTKDLQFVDLSVTLLYRPDPNKLPSLYRKVGSNYAERVLPSLVNEVIKSVTAQYASTQLVTQREQVSYLMRKTLDDRLKGFDIMLDELVLTHIEFSEEFNKSVELKQIAQQEALKMKFVVEQAEQDKKSKIIQAEGDAIAASLYGEWLKDNNSYLELRRIDQSIVNASQIAKANYETFLDSDTLLLNLTCPLTDNLEKDPLAAAMISEPQIQFLQAFSQSVI